MRADPSTRLNVERLRTQLGRYHTAVAFCGSLVIFMLFLKLAVQLQWWVVFYPFLIFENIDLAVLIFASAILIAAVACLVLIGLFLTRDHWLHCPHCGSRTELKHTWVCGNCDKEHSTWRTAWKHAFVETCARETCGKKPHSLICFSCRQPIIWDDAGFKIDTSAWLPEHPYVPPAPPNFDERRKRLRIE